MSITKIGVDISGLSFKYRTGVQNLYSAFLDERKNIEQDLYFLDFTGGNKELFKRFEKENDKYRSSLPAIFTNIPKKESISNLRLKVWNQDMFKALDAFWIYNWKINYSEKVPSFITIPDIIPIKNRQWFSHSFIAATEKSLDFAKNKARHVIAISNYCKNDLIQNGLSEDEVSVIYPGIRSMFFEKSSNVSILQKYGVQKNNYILSVGYLDPRKNLVLQLKAFKNFLDKKTVDQGFRFLIVGAESLMSEDVKMEITKIGIYERLVFTGYVSDDELLSLLDNSSFLSFCSLEEGFGLPVIEAFSRRVPVVTSNTTSLNEIARNFAFKASPSNFEEISDMYQLAIGAKERNPEMINEAYDYSLGFTEKNWVTSHCNLFEIKIDKI